MKAVFIILSFLFLAGVSNAQTGKDFLKNVRSNYEGLKSLELTMEYNLYKGHEGLDIKESFNAVYKRRSNESYRQIHQTEFINTAKYQIQLSHKEKMMVVANPSPIEAFDIDIKTSLKFCQNVLISDEGDARKLTLIIKEKTDLPYSKIDILVDNKFWVKEMTLYYSSLMDFSSSYSNKEMDFPKMVIIYKELKKKWKDKDELFEVNKYFTIENGSFIPSEKYSDYKILNLTNIQ